MALPPPHPDWFVRCHNELVAHFMPDGYREHFAAAIDELSGGGPVLELGIGAGDLAIALLRRGITVHGIDGSPTMLAHLRQRPEAPQLTIIEGDFCALDLPATYSVVFMLRGFATVVEHRDKRAVFENAARWLKPGKFLVLDQIYQRLPAAGSEFRILPIASLDTPVQLFLEREPSGRQKAMWVAFIDGVAHTRHYVRRPITLDQANELASAAGLELHACWDRFETRQPPDPDAESAGIVVYRKPPA